MQHTPPMAACPHYDSCALGRSISMKEALRVWQSFYCEGVFARCERYKLAIAGRDVPDRLLPNGRLQDLPEEPTRPPVAAGR